MLKQLLISALPLLLIIFLCYPTVFAQSPAQAPAAQSPTQALPVAQPPALAPAPPGPPNITTILNKAGHFGTLIRLLKKTKMDDRIYSQLNNSNQGLTFFAPTDDAFANLRSVNIKFLTNLQRIQLLQYHVIPSYLPLSEFETLTNPVNTEAGDNTNTGFPLNVTIISDNQVKITTGIVNTTVSHTIYIDNQLAVYQVDKVLLPLHFLPTLASPAPAPFVPEKQAPPALEISGAMDVTHQALTAMPMVVVSVVATFYSCL